MLQQHLVAWILAYCMFTEQQFKRSRVLTASKMIGSFWDASNIFIHESFELRGSRCRILRCPQQNYVVSNMGLTKIWFRPCSLRHGPDLAKWHPLRRVMNLNVFVLLFCQRYEASLPYYWRSFVGIGLANSSMKGVLLTVGIFHVVC